MPQKQVPDQPRPRAVGDAGAVPVLPVESRDESDLGWGERPEPDDVERLLGDRPPHWDFR